MPRINHINFSISDNPYFARQRNAIRLNLRGDDGALLYPTLKKFEDTGRRTKAQMDEFLSSMIKPSKINIDGLKGVFNCEKIQEDAIRGETLIERPEALRALENAGIKRVIDLRGYDGYEEKCKKNGLEYFGFEAYSIDCITSPREYIQDVINFIKIIQKGDYYIGCSFGTHATDYALLLNEFFNPKCKLISKVSINNKGLLWDYLRMIKITAKQLENDDKKALGWTPEFEKQFNERMAKELAELKKRR